MTNPFSDWHRDGSGMGLMLWRTQLAADQHHRNPGIHLEVALGQSARLLCETEHPFAAGPSHETRCPLHGPRQHVERRPDTDQYRGFQGMAMGCHPALLLGSAK